MTEYNPYDPVDQSKKLKKKIIFVVIISIPVVLVIIWFTFLNFGHISVTAETPFSIFLGEDGTIECDEAPCVIKLKPETRYIGFFKIGHKSIGETIDIKRWGTEELFPKFTRNPFLTELDQFPQAPAAISHKAYELKPNEKTHNWKLTEKNSDNPLSFFPNTLENPKVIGSNSAALIIERSKDQPSNVHYIGIKESTQDLVGTLETSVIGYKISPNGRSFYLKTRDDVRKTQNYLVTSHGITKIESQSKFEESLWTTGNELILIESPSEDTGNEWIFSLYDPSSGQLRELYNEFFAERLTSFHTGNQANKLFFKAGEQGWKLEF